MRVILVLLGVISVSIIGFTQFIWADIPEFWKYGAKVGRVLHNLSIGYLSALIFYVIDIWIPDIQKQKKINKRVKMPLVRITKLMENPLIDIVEKYGEEGKVIKDLSPSEFKKLMKRIDLINDQNNLFFVDANRNANMGEYLYSYIEKVEENINSILKMPFEYDIELIELLGQIEQSTYHEELSGIRKLSGFRAPAQAQGEVIANTVYDYYYLCIKLKKYMKKVMIIE